LPLFSGYLCCLDHHLPPHPFISFVPPAWTVTAQAEAAVMIFALPNIRQSVYSIFRMHSLQTTSVHFATHSTTSTSASSSSFWSRPNTWRIYDRTHEPHHLIQVPGG
jgi:hypothetical protein